MLTAWLRPKSTASVAIVLEEHGRRPRCAEGRRLPADAKETVPGQL
jgi:hypothetical protein